MNFIKTFLTFLLFFYFYSWLVDCVCGAKLTKHGTTYVKLENWLKDRTKERKREINRLRTSRYTDRPKRGERKTKFISNTAAAAVAPMTSVQ